MMRLRDRINDDLIAAMKAKESERLSVIRMMKAAVKNREIEVRSELEDEEVMRVLLSMVKQRKDSVEQFTSGGRVDLAEKETREIKILEDYLPAEVDDEEIGAVIDAVISETGAGTLRDMGKVMKECMARFSGRPVDGGKVSELVRARLG
jgi:uncharacterized protein